MTHPREAITKWGHTATAAGAYMFVERTFDSHSALIGTTDFSPATQDNLAISIMRQSGGLDEVKAGNFSSAFEILNGQWSSLPGGSQEGLNETEAMDAINSAIRNELNGDSSLQSQQGSLMIEQ